MDSGLAAPRRSGMTRRIDHPDSVQKRALRFLVVLEPHLDRAGELDRQRITVAVLGLGGLDANPALAHAIFRDVGLLGALEANADVALKHLRIVKRAARI